MEKMKLDIQRFSGGSYSYVYRTLDMECVGRMYDPEMNDLIKDLVPVLHALEWWQSGDTNEEDYREELDEFKKKWFGTSRDNRLKGYIDKSLEEAKDAFYKMIGE